MQTGIIIEFKYSWLISLWNGKKMFIIMFFKFKFCNYSRYGVWSSFWVHATPGLLNITSILYREHKHHILWPLPFSCVGICLKSFIRHFHQVSFVKYIHDDHSKNEHWTAEQKGCNNTPFHHRCCWLFVHPVNFYPSQNFTSVNVKLSSCMLFYLHVNYVLNFESFPCR